MAVGHTSPQHETHQQAAESGSRVRIMAATRGGAGDGDAIRAVYVLGSGSGSERNSQLLIAKQGFELV